MRVLFVTPAYPPFPGGGERYARSLALQVGERGHKVTVLTGSARDERDFWSPRGVARQSSDTWDALVRVLRLPVQGFPGGRAALLAWRKAMVLLSGLPGDQTRWLARMAHRFPRLPGLESTLARLLDTHDLVHGFNLSWESPVIEAWRLARSRGLPFVLTPFAHLGTGRYDRVARNTTMDHQCHVLSDADAVLVLTAVEREGLAALGAPAAKLSVIGGGVDDLPAFGSAAAALKRYNLQLPLVLFVGRVGFEKGAIHAAEAIRSLRGKGIDVCLALIGQVAPEFVRYARRLSAADKRYIRALGVLGEEEKHALLSASQMLVLPSRTDSFGLVLLEAWQHGKPVIGARAGGIPDVIDDRENGLLVPFGATEALADAIELLLRDEARSQALGECGREKVAARYRWRSVSDRVLAVYDRIRQDQ